MIEKMKLTTSRSICYALILLIVISHFSAVCEPISRSKSSIQIVDSTDLVGLYSSLAIDSSDRPHISYYDETNGDLKYARWDGSNWQIEVVDGTGTDVGMHTSIAIDSNDNPHITYSDETNGDLKYARFDGNNWFNEIIDNDTGAMGPSTIAIDSNDYPHIAYVRHAFSLHYSKWNGSGWENQYLRPSVGGRPSICVDSNNLPHIVYYSNKIDNLINYTYWDGTTWIDDNIDQQDLLGGWPSLILDDDERPHISYYDKTNKQLKYAFNLSTQWDIEVVDNINKTYPCTSIALDSNSNPHISYSKSRDEYLTLARLDGDSWVIQKWDANEDTGQYTDITIDPLGFIHISYYDSFNSDLKYLRIDPPSAPTEPIGLDAKCGDRYVQLKWTHPYDNGGRLIQNYTVYRGLDSQSLTPLWTLSNDTSYNDTTVENGQEYFYSISATNQIGEGNLSEILNATPMLKVNPGNNDTDADTLPDSWELQFFDNLNQTGDDDFDGDGFTNLEEYSAGTDPTDPSDYPASDRDVHKTFLERYWWAVLAAAAMICVALAAFLLLKRPPTESLGDGPEELSEPPP